MAHESKLYSHSCSPIFKSKPLAPEKQVERRKALDWNATLAFPLWPENSNLSKN